MGLSLSDEEAITLTEKLPWDVKQEVLWIVRGYDRRVKLFKELRSDILNGGGENYVTYKVKNEERRAYLPGGGSDGRGVERKEEQLAGLEQLPEVRKMRAVEYALGRVGLDITNSELRQKLRDGIMLNCKNRYGSPFEQLGLVGISQKSFYRRRDVFLLDIAKFLQIL